MKALAVLTNAKKKMDKMLDDFNRALPALKNIGLSVKYFDIDMGLLPEVMAILRGSLEAIDPVKIRHLRESHSENKILGSIL